MKILEKSTESAFNTTGIGREPHGVIDEPDRHAMRRNILDKWLIDTFPNMRPQDKKTFFRTLDFNRPFENAIRPSGKEPHIEKTPFLSFDKLSTMKPAFENWTPTRPVFDNLPPLRPTFDDLPPMKSIDVDFKFDFKEYMPTAAPPHVRLTGVKALSSALGAVVALVIVAIYKKMCRGKASRSRPPSGRVTGVDAVHQDRLSTSTDQSSIPNYPRSPSDQGEPNRSLNDDLPPPYYECALSSIKKYVSDEPPRYTYSKDAEPQVHTRQQNAFIENELEAGAEDGAPGMETELVFDNGKIVERLSLDLNSSNKETGVASTDDADQQSVGHADCRDRVVYVDETDNVKVDTQ